MHIILLHTFIDVYIGKLLNFVFNIGHFIHKVVPSYKYDPPNVLAAPHFKILVKEGSFNAL